MCPAASPEIMCVVHVLKALHMFGIRGKGVIVGDSFTVNSHPNLQTLVVFFIYLNINYIFIYAPFDYFWTSNIKCKTWLLASYSVVWLSCKAVLHVLTCY